MICSCAEHDNRKVASTYLCRFLQKGIARKSWHSGNMKMMEEWYLREGVGNLRQE